MKRLIAVVALCFFSAMAAAKDSPCQISKKSVLSLGKIRDCPDEMAEAEKVTCDNALDDSKKLMALTKACKAKPKKAKAK